MTPDDYGYDELSVLDTELTEYLYDTCGPGDHAPGVFEGRSHGFPACMETDKLLTCTRPEGHTGQHVAEGFAWVYGVWANEYNGI